MLIHEHSDNTKKPAGYRSLPLSKTAYHTIQFSDSMVGTSFVTLLRWMKIHYADGSRLVLFDSKFNRRIMTTHYVATLLVKIRLQYFSSC